MLKKKRGSHVGFVLSFVIFVGFLLFVFLLLQPSVKSSQDKTRYLDTLRLNLFQNISAEGGQVMVIYNKTEINSQQTCARLSSIVGPGEEQIPQDAIDNNRLLIKDLSGNEFNYSKQAGTDMRIGGWVPGELGDNGFFLKVYLLGETNPNNNPSNKGTTTGCTPTASSDYGLTFIQEEGSDYPKQDKIENLTDAVTTEELYDAIKAALDMPSGSDFAFNFTFADGTTIGTGWDVPAGKSLFIRDYSVLYIDRSDELQQGKLTLGIW